MVNPTRTEADPKGETMYTQTPSNWLLVLEVTAVHITGHGPATSARQLIADYVSDSSIGEDRQGLYVQWLDGAEVHRARVGDTVYIENGAVRCMGTARFKALGTPDSPARPGRAA